MELARRAQIDQPTIQRIESNPHANPTARNLLKLARTLEVSVDTLLSEESTDGLLDRIGLLEKRVAELGKLEGRVADLERERSEDPKNP